MKIINGIIIKGIIRTKRNNNFNLSRFLLIVKNPSVVFDTVTGIEVMTGVVTGVEVVTVTVPGVGTFAVVGNTEVGVGVMISLMLESEMQYSD